MKKLIRIMYKLKRVLNYVFIILIKTFCIVGFLALTTTPMLLAEEKCKCKKWKEYISIRPPVWVWRTNYCCDPDPTEPTREDIRNIQND